MRTLFWLCLLLLIPGLLARASVGGAGILATDLVVPLFAIAWAGAKILTRKKFPKNKWIGPALLFFAVASASWMFGAWDLDLKAKVMSAAYLLRLGAMLLLGWAATDLFPDRQKLIEKILLITAVVVGLGFVQFWVVPDIGNYSTEGGWDPHTGRLLGTWLDPNYVAGLLGFILPVTIAEWYRSTGRRKTLLTLLIAAVAYALFLTFSRSGYLAAAVGLIVFFLARDWKILLIGVAIVALGLGTNERAQQRVGELAGTFASIVMQDTDEIDPTAKLRLQNWRKSLTLWEKRPVLGIGYNTYRWVAAEEGVVDESYFSAGAADGTHLTVLVTTGLLGFGAWLWWLGRMWWLGWKQWRKKYDIRSLGWTAGWTALIVHAVFVNSLLFPLIFLPVIALAGSLQNPEK